MSVSCHDKNIKFLFLLSASACTFGRILALKPAVAFSQRRSFFSRSFTAWFTTGNFANAVSETKVNAVIESKFQLPTKQTSDLKRTAVHRMRVAKLRDELLLRGLSIKGNRDKLVQSLLGALDCEQLAQPLLKNDVVCSEISDSSPCAALQGLNATTNLQIEQQNEHSLAILCKNTGHDPNRTYILRVKGIADKRLRGVGIGIVCLDKIDGNVTWMARNYFSKNRTAYEAEYTALVIGLQLAYKRGIRSFSVQLDQSTIVNQLTGKYPVEKESLKHMYWLVMQLKEEVKTFDIKLISQFENMDAENLAQTSLATGTTLNIENDENILMIDPMKEFQFTKLSGRKVSNLVTNNVGDEKAINTGAHVVIEPSLTYLLQFDGGSRGNPGSKAGAGVVLYDENGQEIWCGWKFLGAGVSNNQAEYSALLLGLQCSKSLGIKRIRCEGDSDLVIKQVNGVFQVKNRGLKVLWQSTMDIIKQFEYYEISHIFREKNQRADWLANNAMDLQSSYGFAEIRNLTFSQ